MKKLVTGFQRFRDHVFEEHRTLFEQLASGQTPQALFIGCSDSRLVPALLTQSRPGDLFVLRNAGNLVPPYGAGHGGGEAATIEYAIEALGVEHVVVCGHSHCGAMKALISPEPPEGMPEVRSWLAQAEATRRLVARCYSDREPMERLNVAIQENVLQQLVNLRTHPAVAARLAEGRLQLHAWVYKLESGEIFVHDETVGQFRALHEAGLDGLGREERAP